jgi:hypothetical protein
VAAQVACSAAALSVANASAWSMVFVLAGLMIPATAAWIWLAGLRP